ncbi:desmoglein-2 isoform X2 [Phalacrocorax aristotelis]|uniref:desmoglein-2 isoform X2 n=1 Tax=Phalacrocorax aristotelis TaxID=126867 RepID=UPI003F4BF36D
MSRSLSAAVRLLALLICLNYGNGLYVKVYNRNGRSGMLSYPNSLVRQKREWTVPPAFIREEEDNSYRNPIARIHSDLEDKVVVTYTISGQGVTEPPYGLFVINGKTGELNITGKVDREKTPMLHLRGHALDKTGAKLEDPIDLPIKIIDINDNSPVFSQNIFVGSVEELSETGTIVMKINATDADEPNNLNSKLAFRIISQSPSAAFSIDKDTGEVRVAKINLDRETHSSYSLVVEAKDRGGEASGNAATCSLEIKVLDVNDNLPVVQSHSFEVNIEENRANVEILRIQAFDKDEEFSDNWLAMFSFASGNEDGFFRIVTNNRTNEGILTLVKELDYEKVQTRNLSLVVKNKAEFHKSIKDSFKAQTIPIKINVLNVREGPIFPGGTKIIEASEKLQIKEIIGQYQAYDEDTGKVAKHIRYLKGRDTANWITVDSVTAEIILAKELDYESSYVVNGTYTITILGVTTDFPRKTATGTVIIQVKDENDNCPVIVNPVQTMCSNAELVNVTARDLDGYPNSDPFSFTVIDEPKGTAKKWIIASSNGTSIQLAPQNPKLGRTDIPILIKDFQGFSCAQVQSLQLTVCKCTNEGTCHNKISDAKRVGLGPGAVVLIILAFLLLLLIPLLLLLCRCGSGPKGFAAIPDYSEAMLRQWHSEGAAPEEKPVLSLIPPTALGTSRGATSGAATAAAVAAAAAAAGMSGGETAAGGGSSACHVREHYSTITKERWEEQRQLLSGAEYGAMVAGGAEGMAGVEGKTVVTGGGVALGAAGAMNEEFLRDYFNDKAVSFADEDEAQAANDCLLVYSQGESGSPHGSIGCCSFIEGDLDDHFLDDLGDKFKTLAEICIGRHINMKDGSSRNESGFGLSDTKSQFLDQQNASSSKQAFASGSHFQPAPPVHAGGGTGTDTVSKEVVTETTFASHSGQHDARPLSTAHAGTNFTMTETSYSAGAPAHSAAVFLDPQFKENIVVTERVLAPASSLQGMVEIPILPHGSNVVVTERVVKSEGAGPGALTVQDLPDSQYVVVRERERMLVPAAEQGSISFPALAEGHSVVVTASGMQSRAEQVAGAGSGRQEHMLITDSLLNEAGSNLEGPPPASATLSKSSRVTKYSTVQYTRS